MISKKYGKKASFLCGTLGLALLLNACEAVPGHTLTSEEKTADMYWIYSQFDENYAPLDLKEKLYSFDFAKIKQDYLTRAQATTTNDQFYDLMFNFVAQFRDAHTSAALTNSSLPNRASVSFLGFNGSRKGDKFVVNSLLPTISATSAFPIKVGDVITKMNGKALKDVIASDLLQFRNLGNEEANITMNMNLLFTRISTVNGEPTGTDVTLTLERDDPNAQNAALLAANQLTDPTAKAAAIAAASALPLTKSVDITVPWVTKDLSLFKQQQAAATAAAATPTPAASSASTSSAAAGAANSANFLMVNDTNSILKFNFVGFDGRIQMPFDIIQSVTANVRKKISDSFRFIDNYAQWKIAADTAAPAKTALDNLKDNRTLLSNAIPIEGSDTYPAYVSAQDILDANGTKTGSKKLVGYIYIDSFEPTADEETVVTQVRATLSAFQDLGVKDLIIDTINNGGGSLTLGMRIAQSLSAKTINLPNMQVRLSDTWLDQFETETITPASDAEGEYARRMLQTLRDQQAAGNRLSAPVSAGILAPFIITANDQLTQQFNTVLLVNEMCASMCDIFAGILQDNKLATIVGTNTMGAGGNVVNHEEAPNSHLDVRQTESLMIRADGSYLENSGVKPDVAMAVSESSDTKYDAVIAKAVSLLVTQK